MPDGSLITFKGADFGQTHTYPPNARLFKALRRFLPLALTSKLGEFGVLGGYAIGQDSIFFWYRQDRRSAQPVKLHRVLVDESGVESAVIAYGCSQSLPKGSVMEGCGTTVWPRRSAKVGLRFYQANGTNRLVKIGEFWTRNPHRLDPAQWKPEAVPATRANGHLGITLLGAEYGRLPASSAGPVPEDWRDWGFLRFGLTWKGKPTTAWQIQQCSMEDAGSNTLNLWEHSFPAGEQEILPLRGRFQDRGQSTVLPYTLWPGEAAWRIRITASPRADAQFSPEELCAFRAVPVPAPDEAIPLNVATNLGGATIKLDSICGKDADPSGAAGKFPNTPVLVTAENLSSDHSPIVVGVVDDAGRTIVFGAPDTFPRQVSSNGWSIFTGTPLRIPPTSKALTITFGATTNRAAAFLAAPPALPTTNFSR